MTFGGRLTLVSGKPAMDSDVIGAATLYYAPDEGDTANGITFTSGPTDEIGPSLSLAGLPGNSLHKVFLSSSGCLYLGTPAAGHNYGAGYYGAGVYPGHDPNPPLFRSYGVQVNSAGDPYLGTILIDPAGGTCTAHFSEGGKRRNGIWNRYNQRPVFLKACATPVGIYTPTAVMDSWGPAGNNADNCVTFVTGEPQAVEMKFHSTRGIIAGGDVPCNNGQYQAAIGLDRTNAPDSVFAGYTLEVGALPTSIFNSFSAIVPFTTDPLTGAHTAYALENHRLSSVRAFGGPTSMELTARLMG